MCSVSDCALNCVSTYIPKMPELIMLFSAKSMMRYLLPNGTAGFVRFQVSGCRRVPFPPASTMPTVLILFAMLVASSWRGAEDVGVPSDERMVPRRPPAGERIGIGLAEVGRVRGTVARASARMVAPAADRARGPR